MNIHIRILRVCVFLVILYVDVVLDWNEFCTVLNDFFCCRFSGRTEKQAQIDAQMRLRSPPTFSRTPSRRYQRRIVEGALDCEYIFKSYHHHTLS
jgi:FERM adjacent (FA)